MNHRKLIAILHSVPDDELIDIAEALVDCGITLLEVSMVDGNDPLGNIHRMVTHFDNRAVIGAGMVLETGQPSEVMNLGGRFIFSPYTNPNVIKETRHLGMHSFPGCFSPTECFDAIAKGTNTLALFPVNVLGATGVSALRGILPDHVQLYALGGVTSSNMSIYHMAGCVGFGMKSHLYEPGFTIEQVRERASKVVKTYDLLEAGRL